LVKDPLATNSRADATFWEQTKAALPPPIRLACAYAPRKSRDLWLQFFGLDRRFAHVVATASEPMLAQIRLAWWRETLRQDSHERPHGEPLLESLSGWDAERASLAGLADGWEALVGEAPLDAAAFAALAGARAATVAALMRLVGEDESAAAAEAMGWRWALGDMAAKLSDATERDRVAALLRSAEPVPRSMPRILRPIAVLHALDMRALDAGRPIGGAGDFLTAMRVGLLGR